MDVVNEKTSINFVNNSNLERNYSEIEESQCDEMPSESTPEHRLKQTERSNVAQETTVPENFHEETRLKQPEGHVNQHSGVSAKDSDNGYHSNVSNSNSQCPDMEPREPNQDLNLEAKSSSSVTPDDSEDEDDLKQIIISKALESPIKYESHPSESLKYVNQTSENFHEEEFDDDLLNYQPLAGLTTIQELNDSAPGTPVLRSKQVTRKASDSFCPPAKSAAVSSACSSTHNSEREEKEGEKQERKISLMELFAQRERRWRAAHENLSNILRQNHPNVENLNVNQYVEVLNNEVSVRNYFTFIFLILS